MSRTVKNPTLHRFEDSELDKLAILYGTDKHTNGHGFTLHYENYFSHMKESPIKLLEMGVHTGSSIKMWEDYFKNGEIYGIDQCNLWQNREFSDRVHLTVGNLDRKDFTDNYFKLHENEFDIIIDDAAHTAIQQKAIFEVAFKALKAGGIYVVEDLHTAYWESFGGGYNNKSSMMEYLKALTDCPSHRSFKANTYDGEFKYCDSFAKNGDVSYFDENIYSVHFYRSICFIIKAWEIK